MKSRVLAVLLSVSMLFGSMPVHAAELGVGNEGDIIIDELTENPDASNAIEETAEGDDAAKENEGSLSDGDDSAQDDATSDDEKSNETPDTDDVDTADGDSGNTEDHDNGDVSDEEGSDVPGAGDSTTEDSAEDTVSEDTETDADSEADAESAMMESFANEDVQADVVITSEEDIEALEVGGSYNLTLPAPIPNDYGYSDAVHKWYSFEAPSDGYYNFHVTGENPNLSYSDYDFRLYDDYNNGKMISLLRGYNNVQTNYMEEGDTIYVDAYTFKEDGVTLKLDITELTAYSEYVSGEDGSYVYNTGDYKLSISMKNGFSSIYVSASLEANADGDKAGNYELSGDYGLATYISEASADEYWADNGVTLYARDAYKNSFNTNPLQSGKDYKIHFVLMEEEVDDNYNYNLTPVALFDLVDTFTTIASDVLVNIYSREITECSITFDLESRYNATCYYAPVDDASVQEQSQFINSGMGTYSFTNLLPGTEYYFQFVDDDGNLLYETKESTKETSVQVEYKAYTDTENNENILEATVSGYEGNAIYVFFRYEYTDALGMAHSGYEHMSLDGNSTETEDHNKIYTLSHSIPFTADPFIAGESYEFTVWLEFLNDITLPKETVILTPVATFDDSNLGDLNVTMDNEAGNTAVCTIQINEPLENNITARLYYKSKLSKAPYDYTDIELESGQSGTITKEISVIDVGYEYDFYLFVGGVMRYASLDDTVNANVTLTQVSEIINAFDFVREYTVESVGEEDQRADSYTLKLSYLKEYNDGMGYGDLGSVILSSENDYHNTIKTASWLRLNPDTEYDLKWELYKTGYELTTAPLWTLYDSIHTSKASIALDPVESGYSLQNYNVTLDISSIANFGEDFDSLLLSAYIRKKGNAYRFNTNIFLSSDNGYCGFVAFSGLEAETAYEVSLRDSDGNDVEYAAVSFTTPKDERTIDVEVTRNVSPTIELICTVSGITPSMSGYIYGFINEEGTDIWELAEYKSWSGSYPTCYIYIRTFNGKALKDDTNYNYKIGLSNINNASLSINNLERVKEGTFTTNGTDIPVSGNKVFGITGISTTNQNYPAIKQSDGSYVLAYREGEDLSYSAVVEISPYTVFNPTDFGYSLDSSDKATVDASGNIVPKQKGDVTLTVTPYDSTPYKNEAAEVTLHIKEIPTQGDDSGIYALANVCKKLSDVKFPENWGGSWVWKYPDTPLVTNAVDTSNSYAFEAVSGTDYYPCETTLWVYVGRISGVEVDDTTAYTHNQVVEANGTDEIILRIAPVTQGSVLESAYEVNIPDVNGLKIAKNADGSFHVTAEKKGNYTLKPEVKVAGTGTVLAKTSYKIKAVEEKQAASINLTTDTEGVVIDETNTIIFKNADEMKDFTLNAEVTDRNGDPIATAITWSTTDKTVATATATSKTDTHSANVTAKGTGHTVITATAKDAAGIKAMVNLEIQDHTPRVDTAKVNVNMAYDYDTYMGQSYAYNAGGAVEIVPAYGDSISASDVTVRDKDGTTASEKFEIKRYTADYNNNFKYLVSPISNEITKGTYPCEIYVNVRIAAEDGGYETVTNIYPLTVTVTDKQPGVTAKVSTPVNLFYVNAVGAVTINISEDVHVEELTWVDSAAGENNGFSMAIDPYSYSYNKGKVSYRVNISPEQNLEVANKTLANSDVAKGTLSVKLQGYKESCTFENFKIKYNYKKPTLVTSATSTNIIPSIGNTSNGFSILNKTESTKTNSIRLTYSENPSGMYSYDGITCDSSDVIKLHNYNGSNWISFDYTGSAATKKFTMTLTSENTWREPLKVSHTVKIVKPTAYLGVSQITFNTATIKGSYTGSLILKNTSNEDIPGNIYVNSEDIEGSNAKAQKLLDEGMIIITAKKNRITVEQSQVNLPQTTIPTGSYKYKITPHYTNPQPGDDIKLNTVTITVKVINKPVTVKISPKGNLDLTYDATPYYLDKKNYAVLVEPKFSNRPAGYNESGWILTGEYSDYFSLQRNTITYGGKSYYGYFITKRNDVATKLKAGQTYKLAIEYTLTNSYGEELKVTSNTFKIKPKQTAAKVTVTNNNQTLYAAANNVSRTYYLSVPSGYTIEDATGGIDCNKDSQDDITVSGSGSILTVKIANKDAVTATATGKTYSIPVTVKLKGRDGVAKDAKVTIKVKVKR